jgi:hypothetical protein
MQRLRIKRLRWLQEIRPRLQIMVREIRLRPRIMMRLLILNFLVLLIIIFLLLLPVSLIRGKEGASGLGIAGGNAGEVCNDGGNGRWRRPGAAVVARV